MTKGLQNVDPRQLEFFLSKPGIARRIGVEGTERMRTHVEGERFKTGWVKAGNIYLKGTREMIKKEDWERLDQVERNLLEKIGTERFNEMISSTVRVGNKWYGSGTDVYKVYSALKDGYTTYEEVEQITGLSRNRIDKLIKELVKGGYLQSNKSSTPPTTTVAGSGTGSSLMAGGLGIKGGFVT